MPFCRFPPNIYKTIESYDFEQTSFYIKILCFRILYSSFAILYENTFHNSRLVWLSGGFWGLIHSFSSPVKYFAVLNIILTVCEICHSCGFHRRGKFASYFFRRTVWKHQEYVSKCSKKTRGKLIIFRKMFSTKDPRWNAYILSGCVILLSISSHYLCGFFSKILQLFSKANEMERSVNNCHKINE